MIVGVLMTGLAGLMLIRLFLLAFTVYVRCNFHPVLPAELYRSAQMTPFALSRYHRHCAFRSVLNLRGAAAGAGWYDAELATCQRLGVTHASFRLLSRRVVSPAEVQALLAIMQDLPKPILIHCKRGADRTGLVAALYLAFLANAGLGRAGGQLSWRYGHIGIPYLSEAYPMDISWRREKASLMLSPRPKAISASTTLRA